MLNDLLNYDKIESGTFKLEFRQVDIWKVVKKTVSEFTIQAQNRDVDLRLNVPTEVSTFEDPEQANLTILDPSKYYVLGDDIRLIQVLRNLISNALKFSKAGSNVDISVKHVQEGTVEGDNESLSATVARSYSTGHAKRGWGLCRRRQTDRGPAPEDHSADSIPNGAGFVRIKVKDYGVGLTEDQLGRVFNEGVQFDANKLQHGGGSGLGLCITREIVVQHGGRVTVESPGRNQGTTFTVDIPLRAYLDSEKKPDDHGADSVTVSTSRAGESLHRQHHVLIVDDVISNVKMLVRLLERDGHTCVTAMNGKEAIDTYTAERSKEGGDNSFDTILMDFEMPVLNGPAATKRLREIGCDALIIGVTGNVLAEDVAIFKAHGADMVLPKPINFASIEACWEKA